MTFSLWTALNGVIGTRHATIYWNYGDGVDPNYGGITVNYGASLLKLRCQFTNLPRHPALPKAHRAKCASITSITVPVY